ncbi:MAG: hypothetical protein ACE5DN_04935, partial [Flavobacteriales bacterium]
MKWTVRIGIGIAALAILAVIGSALFAVYYEEDIKQYAIGELNKNLKTELKVERVEMHVFAKFPFISLRFKNIWATDPFDEGGSDSLFYFNAGWLKFNLFDVLRNDYRIRRIELEEGFANLKINNKGEANFDIIKRDDEKSGFLLRLNQCKVRQARVRFTNEMNNDNLDLLADEIAFSGDFSREVFTTRVESEMLVNTLDLHGIQYLQARSLEISAKLNVNKKEKSWKIGNGKASVDHSMPFAISGTFSDRGDKIKLTLDIDSRELQLTPALDLLPDKLKPDMGKYGSDGIIDFKCRISGYAGKSATP